MPAKLPVVRGAADITVRRSVPGALSVTHRSTGAKVGGLTSSGDGKTGWTATHATGKKMPAAPSVSSALAGLIAYHNKIASGKPGGKTVAATADPQDAVDLATPANSAVDGPRVTTMGAGKKAVSKAAVKLKMDPATALVYARLRKKGMGHGQALGLAKRAAAMKAKAA